MCHGILGTSNFWSLLFRIDDDLAARTRAAGCLYCGGVLHSADYPRKPRGVVGSLLGEGCARRLSLCCAQEGCRRRHTPPSVRFLGRRVFLGAVVVLVTALAQGLTGRRVAALREQFGVSERTLRRWRRWWREQFAATSLWKALRGRFMPPMPEACLPRGLLERCSGENESSRLVALLRLLSPLSCPLGSSLSREGG
jgi:hypothetical protein